MHAHGCNSNVDVFAWLCCIPGNLKVCIQPSLKLLRHLNIHSWMMYFVERLPVPRSMLFFFRGCGEFYFGSRAKKPKKLPGKLRERERDQLNPLVSLVLLSLFFPSFSFSPFSLYPWGFQRPEDHQEMLIPICTFRKMEMTYLVSLDEAVAARSLVFGESNLRLSLILVVSYLAKTWMVQRLPSGLFWNTRKNTNSSL